MKQFFLNLKQKIKPWKRKQRTNEPRIVQSIHQQFFERMHNLDYLQWMQQNSARYVMGICVLAVLLSATVLWRQAPVEADKDVAYSYNPMEATVSTTKEPDIASVEQQSIDWNEAVEEVLPEKVVEENTIKKEPTYLNPLHLPGYQAPSSGMLQYNYGLGYDPVYEDYRFHNEICYAAGDGTVFACVSGAVTAMQMDQHWQLAIETQRGTVWYAGLESCNVAVHESVIAGQTIGSADNRIYIQAVKHD